jgi:hypothetical protein
MDAMTFLWLNQHIGRYEQMIVTLFKAAGNTISDFEAHPPTLTIDLQVRTRKFDPHKQHKRRTVATDSRPATLF